MAKSFEQPNWHLGKRNAGTSTYLAHLSQGLPLCLCASVVKGFIGINEEHHIPHSICTDQIAYSSKARITSTWISKRTAAGFT